jgi:hypothetical protein
MSINSTLSNNDSCQPAGIIAQLISLSSDSPWVKIAAQIINLGRKWLSGLSSEGMYEVQEYESTLEIKDCQGQKAVLKKYEKVCYLQNNIIAFQDQAWGDGKNLLYYRCTPGVPVDQYRSGYKTQILISLREVKNKGDIDLFNIEWEICQGFKNKACFWATEISHRMKSVTVKVIFPKNRPPQNASMVERNSQKTHVLGGAARVQLPDGRWMLFWKKSQPRLYEQYILNWDW